MNYIVMAVQEEGSEIRVSDLDMTPDGFPTYGLAFNALDELRQWYPEWTGFHVEEVKDDLDYLTDEDTYWSSNDY